MELDFCTYHANIISRCLAFVELNVTDSDNRQVYLITRSQHILDLFEIYDFPFKHIDRTTNQLQAVDVRTGEAVVIDLTKIETTMVPGDVNIISPPIVGNPIFFDTLSEKDIADIQLPFCHTIKTLKDAGCYEDVTVPENVLNKAIYFRDLSKSCNITLPEDIEFFLSDYIQILTNKQLHDYMSLEKFDLLTARYILTACKQETDTLALDTYEDIKAFITDTESVIKVWRNFLQRLVDKQIKMFNTEFETIILQQSQDMEEREKAFLRLQYDRAVTDLQQLDIEGNLRKFGNNTFMMLRYFPSELRIPEELRRFSTFTSYENAIIEALVKNGITISQNDFIFDYIDFIVTNFITVDFLTQINANYLDKMKEKRLEQIKKCSAEIVEMIKQDTEDLDEEDIQDIISSMQDFESFEEKLNSYNDIGSVIQYWPSVLLPAPDYVTRLAGATQNFIDVQML